LIKPFTPWCYGNTDGALP